MSRLYWSVGLAGASAAAAVVRTVEGTLRLTDVAAAGSADDCGETIAQLAAACGLPPGEAPSAVVVDPPEPLQVVAIAPRQDTFDQILRPAILGLGCPCAGGGLDAPRDQRTGALEARVQSALGLRPDVLAVWDDGSPALQRWWAALALHLAEARRQPAWTLSDQGTNDFRESAVILRIRQAADGPLPPEPALEPALVEQRTVAWPASSAGGVTALWRALADVWRERRGSGYGVPSDSVRLRAETLLWATRFLAARHEVPVVVLDLDVGQVGIYVATNRELRVQHVALGGHQPSSFATWVRSRLPGLDGERLAQTVERHLRGALPADDATLDDDLVLAAGRRGLLATVPANAWLVLTGRLAAALGDPARAALWLLDAARPRGQGKLLWDDADALALVAALAPAAPEVATALAADGCIPLGTYVAPEDQADLPPLALHPLDGPQIDLLMPPGTLRRLPLRHGEQLRVTARDRLPIVATGGPGGLIVDARPRSRDATQREFQADRARLDGDARAREDGVRAGAGVEA